jgi:hypothetical protein
MAIEGDPGESGLHGMLLATRVASENWFPNVDGRLAPQVEPGILEARVSAASLPRALAAVQEVIARSQERGMLVFGVDRGRHHRPGIAIGREDVGTPLRVVELRDRVSISEDDLAESLRANPRWWMREEELRERGWLPRANGRLRVLLLPRHDPRPDSASGWRSSFSDQEGRTLEQKLGLIVDELAARSATGWSPARPRR